MVLPLSTEDGADCIPAWAEIRRSILDGEPDGNGAWLVEVCDALAHR